MLQPRPGSDADTFIGIALRRFEKPGMHLGADRPRAGTVRRRPRATGPGRGSVRPGTRRSPACPTRGAAAIDQHRDTPGRRVLRDLRAEGRREQRQPDLVERDPRLGQQQPGSQRPGRVVLVADDEREHAVRAGRVVPQMVEMRATALAGEVDRRLLLERCRHDVEVDEAGVARRRRRSWSSSSRSCRATSASAPARTRGRRPAGGRAHRATERSAAACRCRRDGRRPAMRTRSASV